jgi:hypothetical protein
MREEPEALKQKADEILKQMRADTSSKQHQDQAKIRARAALRRAIDARNRDAYVIALFELGIDIESKEGKQHLRDFEKLPRNSYRR